MFTATATTVHTNGCVHTRSVTVRDYDNAKAHARAAFKDAFGHNGTFDVTTNRGRAIIIEVADNMHFTGNRIHFTYFA